MNLRELYELLVDEIQTLGEAGKIDLETGRLAAAMLLVGLCEVYGGDPLTYVLKARAGLAAKREPGEDREN